MTKSGLLGAAAVALVSALASPAMAQEVIYNPGYCAQFYPNANCQNRDRAILTPAEAIGAPAGTTDTPRWDVTTAGAITTTVCTGAKEPSGSDRSPVFELPDGISRLPHTPSLVRS